MGLNAFGKTLNNAYLYLAGVEAPSNDGISFIKSNSALLQEDALQAEGMKSLILGHFHNVHPTPRAARAAMISNVDPGR